MKRPMKDIPIQAPSQAEIQKLINHYQNGQYGDAETLAISITEQFPDHQFSWKVLGVVLKQTGKISESLVASQKSVKLAPQDAEAQKNLGVTLQEIGRLEEAEASYRQAISVKSDYAEAHSNLGVTLQEIGRLEEAEASYRQAISVKPDYADAHNNLGNTLKELGRLEEAEASYRQAISVKSDYAEAHSNLGVTLQEIGRLEEAEASYRQAISVKPDYADAHYNLGITLKKLGRIEEAIESTKKSLAINPDYVDAKINLSSFKGSNAPDWHLSMMNDRPRNKAYFDAIKLAIKDDDLVLEIGTGSGLLSMMAADAGAKKVITCESSKTISEVAEKIIYKNGYSGIVNVVKKNSIDLIVGKDLPRKADVVISEILSAEFVGEGVRSTIFDANNRLLDENGRMIPESGNIMIALLGDNAEIINKVSVDNVNGFDLSKFNSITSTKFSFHLSKTPKFLSKAEVAFKLNLYDKQKVSRKELILTLIAQEAGICVGVIQWMKIQLFKDIRYENKPGKTSSHWPTPIYRFDNPVKLKAGQELKIKATLLEDSVWFSHFE